MVACGSMFVADLEYVLTEGPWMVTNQYLVVQRWRPNFVPGEEPIRVMPLSQGAGMQGYVLRLIYPNL
ncbi:hypothetical protein ACOSQ3_019035 [Xanthoceras sorbifolium]